MLQPVLPGLLSPDDWGPWHPVRAAEAAHAALFNVSVPVVCLYGPMGSGKSHLLMLAAAHGAQVWDDLHQLPHDAQPALFHALQQALQGQGVRVAVASPLPVAQLENLLPDIKSRLLTAPQLEVGLPDDEELRDLLGHWADLRQLHLPSAVADYVLVRAARNPAALRALLARLDELSLEEKRAITVPLARQLLEATA